MPSRVMAGTESFPMQSFQTWDAVVSNPWVIGDFIWTAIDYIGRPILAHLSRVDSDSMMTVRAVANL